MVVEIVSFPLPPGTTRAQAASLYAASAQSWATNPVLIAKYFTYDEERCLGGGVYIWPSREAARQWHGADYLAMVEATYGSAPTITLADALIVVDPRNGTIDPA